MDYKVIAGLLILLMVAYISGLSWDDYVFVESGRLFLKGFDPYSFANDVRAYLPGLGPMWIAYPPLPIYLWSIFEAPLVWLNVPLSAIYSLCMKLPSILALVLSAYLVRKMRGNWKWVIFNPLSIAVIFIHGMFDSLVAFFLLLSIFFIKENREVSSGIAYGLALASKQHALLAALPFLAFFLKRKDFKGLISFVASAAIIFISILLIYEAIFDFKYLKYLIDSVFLFHAKRPPNGLGFGGFAVLNFYGDTIGGFAGNTAVALQIGGSAAELSKAVDKASLVALPAFLLTMAFGLPEGIFIAYMDYILLSYVGALQHLVVPAVLAAIVLSRKNDRKLMSIFFILTMFYATEHLLSFWDFFPIIVSPLFLKELGMWSAELSRIVDIILPYWDVYLRMAGIFFTTIAIFILLIFVSLFHKYKLKRFSRVWILIPTLYILELVTLNVLLGTITTSVSWHKIIHTSKWCLLDPWENTEYPGYRFGDYLSPYSVPTQLGYFSYVKPVADRLVKIVKGKCNLAILARLDLFREYQYTDLISSIMEKGLTYAWVLVLDDNSSSYVYGISSTPLNNVERTFTVVVRNIPLDGYFKLGGIIGAMNTLFHFTKLQEYKGYFTYHGRPVIFVIAKSQRMMNIIKEFAKKYEVVVLPFKGTILNIKDVELSTTST